MKTRQIPAIIMLIAGLVTSVAGIINHMETVAFLKTLVIVLIIFYVIGCVAKVVIDRNFKEEKEEAVTEEEAEEVEEIEEESAQEE